MMVWMGALVALVVSLVGCGQPPAAKQAEDFSFLDRTWGDEEQVEPDGMPLVRPAIYKPATKNPAAGVRKTVPAAETSNESCAEFFRVAGRFELPVYLGFGARPAYRTTLAEAKRLATTVGAPPMFIPIGDGHGAFLCFPPETKDG